MTARRDAAAVLAICAAVRKTISEIEDAAKDEVDCSYADEKVAAVVDGVVVATTGRYESKPPNPFQILDEAGFVAWVQERWPTEIVQAVRPSFLANLWERVQAGHIIDDDGEACMAVKVKEPTVSVRTYLKKTDEATAALQPFMAVALTDLPKLIEGGDEL